MRFLLCAAILFVVAVSASSCGSSSSAQQSAVVQEFSRMEVRGITRLDSSRMLFMALDTLTSEDEKPWVTDGTELGTFRLKDLSPGLRYTGDADHPFPLIDGYGYFVADDGVNGSALWRTDGTEIGTTLESVLVASPIIFNVVAISASADTVFVSGYTLNPQGGLLDHRFFAINVS